MLPLPEWERRTHLARVWARLRPSPCASFGSQQTIQQARCEAMLGRAASRMIHYILGGAGVVSIPRMQKLLHYICENGFEHHAAANLSTVVTAVYEATSRYFGHPLAQRPRPDIKSETNEPTKPFHCCLFPLFITRRFCRLTDQPITKQATAKRSTVPARSDGNNSVRSCLLSGIHAI